MSESVTDVLLVFRDQDGLAHVLDLDSAKTLHHEYIKKGYRHTATIKASVIIEKILNAGSSNAKLGAIMAIDDYCK